MSRTTLAWLASRCPWGVVGMLALVVLAESLINLRALDLFDIDEWAFRRAGYMARSPEVKAAQVLCFGDSLVKLGVIPSVVAERTGKRVYNLALSGSQAPTSYFLLKRALDAGAKPEAVVVDFTPPLLRVGPRHLTTRWMALIDPAEAFRLARWARDPALFGEVALGGLIPSLRGKSSIRAAVLGALAARPSPNAHWNGQALRNWERNAGAQLMTGHASPVVLDDAQIHDLLVGYYPRWDCHPANYEGIGRFLDLASKNQIRVHWVLAPLLPALHDQIRRSGIDGHHEAFVRHWQAKYPDLRVVDGRGKVADLDLFWDPQHLSVEGASAFSRALGDVLRRSEDDPAGRRWVALPPLGKGPVPAGIENMEESRVAFEQEHKPQVRR